MNNYIDAIARRHPAYDESLCNCDDCLEIRHRYKLSQLTTEEFYSSLNNNTVNDQKLDQARQLSDRVKYLRNFIIEIESGKTNLLPEFLSRSSNFQADYLEPFPIDQLKGQYVKNLKAKLAKLEEEYNSL